MVANGSRPSFFKMKKTVTPKMAKHAKKYNATNPMMIFIAKLEPKDAERKKDFHSSQIKCLNIN